MRILSKGINEQSTTHDAYCIGNTARPLLSYGPKAERGNRKTFLYVEAIKKFRDIWSNLSFDEVYKKAVPIYTGQLEHTFIVLKENYEAPVTTGSNNQPLGSQLKRQATTVFGGSSKRRV